MVAAQRWKDNGLDAIYYIDNLLSATYVDPDFVKSLSKAVD